MLRSGPAVCASITVPFRVPKACSSHEAAQFMYDGKEVTKFGISTLVACPLANVLGERETGQCVNTAEPPFCLAALGLGLRRCCHSAFGGKAICQAGKTITTSPLINQNYILPGPDRGCEMTNRHIARRTLLSGLAVGAGLGASLSSSPAGARAGTDMEISSEGHLAQKGDVKLAMYRKWAGKVGGWPAK